MDRVSSSWFINLYRQLQNKMRKVVKSNFISILTMRAKDLYTHYTYKKKVLPQDK